MIHRSFVVASILPLLIAAAHCGSDSPPLDGRDRDASQQGAGGGSGAASASGGGGQGGTSTPSSGGGGGGNATVGGSGGTTAPGQGGSGPVEGGTPVPDGGTRVPESATRVPESGARLPDAGGAVVVDPPPPISGSVVVAPNGDDTNPGTVERPFYSLSKAVATARPGTTILLRAGTYKYSATIALSASGTATQPIRVWAYGNEKPVLDFSGQPYGSEHRALMLTGDYWHIKGIEVAYAGDNGIKIEGSHNKIEQCVFHHNGDSGLQLGFAHETVNPNGEKCAYNEVINCDSYLNFDFDSKGGDADGFACKMHNGKGNVFRGSRAWHNADDGWDLYETDWPVEITDCWTWHNGDQTDFDAIYLAKMGVKMSSYSGNGNGFKLGGNGTGGNSAGTHVVKNSVSFAHNFRSKKGFDQNSHQGGVLVVNSVAWGNGYNFMFEDNPTSGNKNEFVNNVSFLPKTSLGMEFSSGAVLRNNSWQIAVTADAADFVELTEEAAAAPRQADGSLPNNGFARLTAGSDLIDRGVDVALPFRGSAPDLGAFEH